jgi:hypothetical protein
LRRRIAARRLDKPVAVFRLAGAPGVGKTHFAKILAEELDGGRIHLHFFDKSQFGQARGYVGSNSYGSMAAALRDVPNAIVLLDEFEKAQSQKLRGHHGEAAQETERETEQEAELGLSPFLGYFKGCKKWSSLKWLIQLVGVAGFEPATPASRTQ